MKFNLIFGRKLDDSTENNLECIETCAKYQIRKKLQDLKNIVDDDEDDDDNNENFEHQDEYQGLTEQVECNFAETTNEDEHHKDNEIQDQQENESASDSNGQYMNNFGQNPKIPNISPNLTALLYTNPHLANLFSMFNFPILSQYLNGFKKPDHQTELSNFLNKQNQHSKNSSSTNLSVETRLVNNINESNKSNNYASPSSSYSSASSTSSASSFKAIQSQTVIKSAHSDDNLSFHNIQLEQLQKQFQQESNSSQNFSKEKKQRERTTFDPHEEISRLMQIFEQTHHPSRYQIASICDSLNSLACRKDKKPLEPYNIQYWFKNARAALRRKSKSENSNQSKNGHQNDLGSNEDSKNSFDDFDEANLDKVESCFLNQKGLFSIT